ncbi:unnamed protein product [Protopolystoma xenopodis]|uniref:EGF-like domain-containing protein n=1 Tax=Protopolystoma xenopodis TaxID=117903 RepID=A0A448WGC5_9PLAT|nr:unnamed protein product [Protopolystoma xenopodis]
MAVSSACNCPTCSRLTGAVDSSTLLPVAEPEVSPSSEESLEAGSELGTLPLAVRRCSARGRLVCGSCQCQRGHTGDFCECDAARWPEHRLADMLAECTQPGAKQPCSGRGRCTCGRCKCQQSRFDGRFCECDRQGCKRASDDNQVCGGPQRGVCRCDGICECKPGYTGDRCDCMQSERNCIDPTGPVVELMDYL